MIKCRSENGCGKWHFFGLKWGVDLEMRAAHPHQKFQGIPPPPHRDDAEVVVHKRQCPHYPGGIWKRSLISTVRPNVHINTFENALQTVGIWKRWLFVPVWTGNNSMKAKVFSKRWPHYIHVISPPEIFSNTNRKWPMSDAFLYFYSAMWTEETWCVFIEKPPFSNPLT